MEPYQGAKNGLAEVMGS